MSRLKTYFLLAVAFWTVVTGLSLGINWYEMRVGLLNQLKARTSEAMDKDLIYRMWSAQQGGVYVPITSQVSPNPNLQVPDRDVTTTDGKKLTLVNPAYMTRMVNELQKKRSSIQSHLTSLDPIRPENAPDEWEKQALLEFNKGTKEYYAYTGLEGNPVFRSMIPFVVEEPCMKCHEQQGYKIGDIRGGISVAIPLQSSLSDYNASIMAVFGGHLSVWLVGLVFLFWGRRKLAESWQAESDAYQESERQSKDSQEFIHKTLDALNANIAILEKSGTIQFVNESWKRFATENDANIQNYGVGLNYFEFCGQGQDECSVDGPKVLNMIRELIEGKRSAFILEYPCHSPTEQRWFEVRGTMFMFKSEPRIVLAHENITRLKTSEARFRTFVEVAPIGLWTTDAKGANTYVSPNWSNITGISYDDATGAGWSQGLHPDDRDRVYRQWTEAALKNESYESYFRFVRPDGSVVWALCQALCVGDGDNHAIEWLGTITDITELKLAQEELKVGEARLLHELAVKSAINSVLEPLLSLDCSLTDVAKVVLEKARELTGSKHGYVNETDVLTGDQVSLTLTQMFGKDCEMKEPRQTRFPKGVDGLYPGLWGYSLNDRKPFFTNYPSHHPNSKGLPQGHVPIERFLSVPVIYGSELVGQIALANPERDYSDVDIEVIEKIASYYALGIQKKRSQENQDILNSAIQNSAEAVVITDSEGGILDSNKALEKITGYSLEDAMGRTISFLDLFSQHGDYAFKDVWEPVKDASTWFGVLEGKRKDGGLYTCQCSVTPVIDSDGQVANVVVLIRDISKELRLKEQLAQSQKMEAIGTLAGGIAHDFNNIIFAITGSAELAMDKISENSPLKPHLEQILKSGERAADMVRQILTFSRRSQTEKTVFDVVPVIKEGLKFLRGAIPSTIEINQYLDPNLPKIYGDPTQIYQVLMNLCTNATHAIGNSHGKLSVTLEHLKLDQDFLALHPTLETGECLKLTVSDSGTGISPDVMARIFEPYFTTKEVGEGTGLGLAVIHGIVQNHGGVITVTSQPGEGTTFSIFFPVICEFKNNEEKTEQEIPRSCNERILWVDDEETIISMVCQSLEEVGFQVTITKSPLKALELFRESPNSFDIVITDQSMPKMTGIELAKEIKALRADIPVILCTGFGQVFSDLEPNVPGINSIIYKPITRKELILTIFRELKKEPVDQE